MIRPRYGPSAPCSRFLYGLFPFQGGMPFRRMCSYAGGRFASVFLELAHLDGAFWGIVFSRCFLTIRFSGNDFLRERRRIPSPRGNLQTGISLFWALPAGNRSNGRIRPGTRGEWREIRKLRKSGKIVLVNTVQNHDAWHIHSAFCLSAEAFPFIVTPGSCTVPVVQWIERVSPKD